MKHNVGTLTIQRIIIHEIPWHRAGADVNPGLSEVDSPLSDELRLFFQERIKGAVGSSSAFDVLPNQDAASPIPSLLFDLLTEPKKGLDFIETSHQVAMHLCNIQTGANSPGLLAVVDCTMQGYPSLAILKLEKEEGVRLEELKIDGRNTFNLDLIKELILSSKTKLFKSALFVQSGKILETIEGTVHDYQRPFAATLAIADFFLRTFLGCTLAEEPDVLTQRFLDTAEDFINDQIPDPATRGEYLTHLTSELTSQSATVNPREFARRCMRPGDGDDFIHYLEEKGARTQSFDKNTALVKNRLTRMQIEFESGIRIIAPKDVYDDKVRLTLLDNGETRAEVRDRLRLIRGK